MRNRGSGKGKVAQQLGGKRVTLVGSFATALNRRVVLLGALIIRSSNVNAARIDVCLPVCMSACQLVYKAFTGVGSCPDSGG